MNENQYLENQRKHGPRSIGPNDAELPPEAIDYEPAQVSDFEQTIGKPFIISKLQIDTPFDVDPEISTKAQAVEEFIKSKIKGEALRDSEVSYETILNRYLDKYPVPLEKIVQQKNGIDVLDYLFQQVALENRKSSETYLEDYGEKSMLRRVSFLLGQLKHALRALCL